VPLGPRSGIDFDDINGNEATPAEIFDDRDA